MADKEALPPPTGTETFTYTEFIHTFFPNREQELLGVEEPDEHIGLKPPGKILSGSLDKEANL